MRAMQAKDIADDAFVAAAVKQAAQIRGHSMATRWDVAAALAGHPERIPDHVFDHDDQPPQRVVLAKARKLIRRKVIDGCACGCRGDFEVA